MQMPDPSSSPWADKILNGIVGGSILASVLALVKLIFYRNKPKADVAEIDARTDGQKADTAIKLSNQLLTLHHRMNLMEASIDTHQQETAETIKYYRKQIDYFERLDLAYRNRSHAMAGELGRLVLAITNQQLAYTEKTREKPEPLEIHTYDQIIEPFPLPTAPE